MVAIVHPHFTPMDIVPMSIGIRHPVDKLRTGKWEGRYFFNSPTVLFSFGRIGGPLKAEVPLRKF